MSIALPPQAWKSIWRRGALIMMGATLLSVVITRAIDFGLSAEVTFAGAACALFMPLILGGPILTVLLIRHEQLLLLNDRLHVLASTDGLTACLNRRAFVSGVSTHLADRTGPVGTLLVIDADNFKAVNDRFGHDTGDEALALMAAALRSCLRGGDLIGRLGGEEFGVFLVGASQHEARCVVGRMLAAIRDIDLRSADGRLCSLSVSIGGAATRPPETFASIYRLADRRLYGAKQSGRDRAEFIDEPA
jgi:diguanylate cyclase (GGDEF)-like protein